MQRDLQDALEREADLREQLKFAEEEVNRLTHLINQLVTLNLRWIPNKRALKIKQGTPEPSVDGVSVSLTELCVLWRRI